MDDNKIIAVMTAVLFTTLAVGIGIGYYSAKNEVNVYHDQILIDDDSEPKRFDVYRNADGTEFEFVEVTE